MIDPTPDLKSEISSLQWLTETQLKAQYADLLGDAKECHNVELLRSVLIYRLQERFYGIHLQASSMKVITSTVEGNKILKAPTDGVNTSKRRLVRNWKGVDYEVVLHSDNRVEYDGRMYRSLTAVAKAITGSHWNGPVFFGVKK